MKKILLLFITSLLVSCGASKTTSGEPKEKTLKGEWEISDVKFQGKQGTYKAKMFGFDDTSCFKNSTWMFIPNNNTGKFTTAANNSTCESKTARIIWSFVQSETGKLLQFKYVNEKNKNIDAMNRGYQLKIKSLTPTSMTATVSVIVNGSPFDVHLIFNKISENVNLKS